ncbi:hypothetical protein ACFOEE_09820 [Pseudoalteromonas fenneropenaei]|uniref:Lipoprotein n=1 Tax=Pseudoalteromonas fenneropenaei TaxID=1737459 RepID=A0ABV7CJI8_9GAMM
MKLFTVVTSAIVLVSFSMCTYAKPNQINEISFFQENFNLSDFKNTNETTLSQLIRKVNSGELDSSSGDDIKNFIELGFSDDLDKSEYFCTSSGCILFLSLNHGIDRASKYRSDSYISNINNNDWYRFKSKDVFESDNKYYLVLLR